MNKQDKIKSMQDYFGISKKQAKEELEDMGE
jgi:hypothetical protein